MSRRDSWESVVRFSRPEKVLSTCVRLGVRVCCVSAIEQDGYPLGNGFSSAKYSLIDRGIIWANAHIRGGMECGMQWWKNGKMLKKKNTFEDYIQCAMELTNKKYTSEGLIIGMGGSAGGLLMGAVLNMRPKLFSSVVMAVSFVDSLTTNLDHSLPLTVG